jgi:hypothetical protein
MAVSASDSAIPSTTTVATAATATPICQAQYVTIEAILRRILGARTGSEGERMLRMALVFALPSVRESCEVRRATQFQAAGLKRPKWRITRR